MSTQANSPGNLTPAERTIYPKPTVNSTGAILVGRNGRVVWIRVEGKGSFQNSSGVKEVAKEMINRGFRDFVIDLKDCPVMDSTFMGTLAGVALRLREIGLGSLHVTNLNPRNQDLLESLGLNQLFELDVTGSRWESERCLLLETKEDHGTMPAEKLETSQVMLEAHEALVEVFPENLSKFKDVLEFLKQDLQQEITQ